MNRFGAAFRRWPFRGQGAGPSVGRAAGGLLLALGTALACSKPAAPPPKAPSTAPKEATHVHRFRPKQWPRDAVEQARAPFSGRRTADGSILEQDALLETLSEADVICAGESHDDPAHHYVQLAILERLLARAPQTARTVAVGFEMLPQSAQSALDRFTRRELDDSAFLHVSDWKKNWGFDFSLYRPLLERARQAGAELLALNAEGSAVRTVARKGLAGLEPDVRKSLPELDLDDPGHRRAFEAAMAEHPDTGMNLDHLHQAQVLWDETMADAAARWLQEGTGARQLLIIAGAAHCRRFAIAQRVERRVPVKIASVAIESSPGTDRAAPSHSSAKGRQSAHVEATPAVDFVVSIQQSAASRAAP